MRSEDEVVGCIGERNLSLGGGVGGRGGAKMRKIDENTQMFSQMGK